MRQKGNIILGAILIFLLSCTNTKEAELINVICVDEFTYTDCVKEIIDNNCVVCHNSGNNAAGPFPLETYEQVKDKTQNGNILTRIQLPDGANGIMPQTGKMTQAKIDVIVAWANSGYME